jgi:hypothetical protein
VDVQVHEYSQHGKHVYAEFLPDLGVECSQFGSRKEGQSIIPTRYTKDLLSG